MAKCNQLTSLPFRGLNMLACSISQFYSTVLYTLCGWRLFWHYDTRR